MGIDFPSSLTASIGQKFTYSGQEYEFNGTAWRKVKDRVTSFNGATGAIIGVTSVQGKTGDVTLTDLEITHGVETFNGLSGSIDTTSLTLPVAGISASGGVTASGGLANISSTKTFRIGKPGTGIGSGPFAPQTYSFPTTIEAAGGGFGGDVDPTLLVNQSVGIAFSGDTPLEFIKLSKFTVKSFNGATGDVEGVNSFNGLTGAVVTDTLILPCAGISGPSAITFDNGEVIRNSPDGSIQIIPSDEGGNHYGIEIDATEWGFGPAINVIDESGTQVSAAIRFDTDVVMSNTNVPDGTPARLLFNNASDRGFQQNNNGDGTVMFGVNGNNGHFAVGRKADLSDGERSMSADDKTALSMSNPQFLVYSADHTDANDYLRIEHDQTDANIFSGNGNINLVPAGGVVGVSGGTAEADNFVVDGGKISQKGNETTTHIDMSSAQDITIKAGDDIKLNPDGSSSFVFRNDGTNITVGRIFGAGDGRFISVSDDMSIIDIGDLDTVSSSSKIRLSDEGVSLFDGSGVEREVIDTSYRRNTDVATFTISASSAIATGKKTDSLYRLPYNATLKNVDVKVSATGGFTAGMFIAGSDFGLPATGSLTGATLGVSGLTASSTSFDVTTLTGGNYLFFDVINNDSGSTQAQMFVTFESR